MRYILLHLEDTETEDALMSVLGVAHLRARGEHLPNGSDGAMGHLADHVRKIHIGPSGPVPKES